MQIACKRYGCQKAVEVCYWTCKYRRNCKDWAMALAGEPGRAAISERLEASAIKSGRVFDAKSLSKPVRAKKTATASPLLAPIAKPVAIRVQPALPLPKPDNSKASKSVMTEKKTNSKPQSETDKSMPEAKSEVTAAKPVERKTAPKAARAKSPTSGTIYILLSKNGKYRELREAELLKEAANILRDPSLRLVKGQYLVPQITFKPIDD